MESQKKIVLGGTLVLFILAIAAYPAVMNILAVGTTRYSEVISGPATLTFRQLIMDPMRLVAGITTLERCSAW